MVLIKNGEVVDNPWVRIGTDETVPTDKPALIPLARWQAERDKLLPREAPLGVVLESGEQPADIADDLQHFDVIALEFPTFRDGRAFSSARVLRDRYGFTGEIRAVGNILRDQLLFLHRAGFDAVEIPASEDKAQADWQKALAEISIYYQDTHDGRPTVLRARHG